MKQRQVLGRQIALVDLQLLDDSPQFGVARFEPGDGRSEISCGGWP
jgi:hypothetical protein